jgi:hypothetical protein
MPPFLSPTGFFSNILENLKQEFSKNTELQEPI